MKLSYLVVGILTCVGMSNTYAGFGAINALTSKLTQTLSPENNTQLTSASDYAGYFNQVKETKNLFLESRTILASLLVSKEESNELKTKLKTLKTTSDAKEKEALVEEMTKMSNEVLSAAQKDEAGTVQKLSELSVEQRDLLIGSATNFLVAGLKARDLVVNAKAVSASILTNPSAIMNSGLSLVDAKNLVGDVGSIAKNSSMALVEYPKLFKKAGIELKVPESAATKPVDVSLDF